MDDIQIPSICPVLGIPIDTSTTGTRGFRESAASLDRIRPVDGYVPGNIRVISNIANSLKRAEVGPDRLRAVADYIERENARIDSAKVV
jgi:hypothetical protein